ncbi:ATP-binding cassette transporter [Mycena sanguinolenta]|uniref:ATP-binding cassette transporter n=1 Tax=Mycena sanguinolenta TaxID=230812 RepID=A0A8H6Y244_9AGAR|nr:ATP-binding cassette transporter [Mycena sanguinolenta]
MNASVTVDLSSWGRRKRDDLKDWYSSGKALIIAMDASSPSRSDRGLSILKGFNLEVAVGESVAIVGQSGGGKSSVHSLLLRYYDPIEGKITFDGQDIREFSIESWRSVIGIVPQDPVLFTGTIASNIAFGNPGATREQIEQAARDANCEFVWGDAARV